MEYRRDADRFLRGQSTELSTHSTGYFDAKPSQELAEIQARISHANRREETLTDWIAAFWKVRATPANVERIAAARCIGTGSRILRAENEKSIPAGILPLSCCRGLPLPECPSRKREDIFLRSESPARSGELATEITEAGSYSELKCASHCRNQGKHEACVLYSGFAVVVWLSEWSLVRGAYPRVRAFPRPLPTAAIGIPTVAADYLDAREAWWQAWPTAQLEQEHFACHATPRCPMRWRDLCSATNLARPNLPPGERDLLNDIEKRVNRTGPN